MDKKVIFQRLGLILAYPLAYAYIRFIFNFDEISKSGITILDGKLTIAVTYPVFALMFILVNISIVVFDPYSGTDSTTRRVAFPANAINATVTANNGNTSSVTRRA